MKEFYFLAKFQMAVPGTDGAAGGIIIPSGIASHTLTRRDLDQPALQRRLLDPQVYLAHLQADRCRSTCTKLASYPWFLADGIAHYDSGQQTQAQWRRATEQTILEHWRGSPSTTADIQRSAVALMFLTDDEKFAEKMNAGEQAAIAGNVNQVQDIVGAYQAAGVDELIVPDFTMGADKLEILDKLINEVAPVAR